MILYNILLSNRYARVLEIGSYYGASTTAFIEALDQGCQFELHLCDICFKDIVRRLCEKHFVEGKVFFHECASSDYLMKAPAFDFAFLDGSHIAEHLQDEFELLSMQNTETYVLHDTRTQLLPESKYTPWFDGPLLISNKLKSSPDWLCLEDSIDRQGEQTKRGLFFATKNLDQYMSAKGIFNYWNSVSTQKLIEDMG